MTHRDRYTMVRRWLGLRWDVIDETTGERVVRARNAEVALSYVGILLAADLQASQ